MPSLVSLLLVLLAGQPTPLPPRRYAIPDVPFLPQEKQRCGPAALAMVLHYYGAIVDPGTLSKEIYLRQASGTLNLDLLLAARRHGFSARAESGTLRSLKECVARDIPVIAMLGLSPASDSYHYVVVFGYDDESRQFTLHSGRTAAKKLPFEEFDRAWALSKRWMLTVERKETWP